MEKIKDLLKTASTFNIIKIAIGALFILYSLYAGAYVSIFANAFKGQSFFIENLLGEMPWIILGIVLILDGLYKLNKQNVTSPLSTPEIIQEKSLIVKYAPAVFFIICFVPFTMILNNSLSNWMTDMGIKLFYFLVLICVQLPFTLIAVFSKNKKSLKTAYICLSLGGLFILFEAISFYIKLPIIAH